jgi:hypothetical protein
MTDCLERTLKNCQPCPYKWRCGWFKEKEREYQRKLRQAELEARQIYYMGSGI